MKSNIGTIRPFGLSYLCCMIYLNTAGTGKISKESVAYAQSYLNEMVELGSLAAVKWRTKLDLPIKERAAELLGTKPDQVALIPNTSYGLNTIAQRLRNEKKSVLVVEGDYPSIVLPWMLLGYDVKTLNAPKGIVDESLLIDQIESQQYDIVVVSHVMWHSGYRSDIDAIGNCCASNNVISIVDATQSLGVIPINFDTSGIDVILSSSYKWLHAGFGIGLTAMSEKFFKAFPPEIGGYASFQEVDDEWAYKPSMKSYQPGSVGISASAMLFNSLGEIHLQGVDEIYRKSMKNAEHLVALLKKNGFSLLGRPSGASLSPIVCVESVSGLFDYLATNNVIVVERDGRIRFSVTHSTTTDELDQLDGLLSVFVTV
ncbi:MAG: aminotransferase class V-fold PLP-dependent enzyme [Flavobacteriales bacterium]|nr:aminotransferase class V-fold PLP-dependent enzyme [Flavobacteriales bacterium]